MRSENEVRKKAKEYADLVDENFGTVKVYSLGVRDALNWVLTELEKLPFGKKRRKSNVV